VSFYGPPRVKPFYGPPRVKPWTTVVIDREGKVVGNVDSFQLGRLESTIKDLLDEDTPR
jgi:hypothetical protein